MPDSETHNRTASCTLRRARLLATLYKGARSLPVWCSLVPCDSRDSRDSSLHYRQTSVQEKLAVLWQALKMTWPQQNLHSPSNLWRRLPRSRTNSSLLITTLKMCLAHRRPDPTNKITSARPLSYAAYALAR